jgi:ABC-type multidrug transport system ATPase subunit
MEIIIENLTKTYRGGVQALSGINLRINTGMFGLLGPNGAGKTTLMRVLVTLIQPTGGEVSIGGNHLNDTHGKQNIRRQLGYLPQDLGLYPDLSAEEFVDYVAILKGLTSPSLRRKRVNDLLETVNLIQDRKRKIKTFSGGMKRRVGIAQALVNDPQLLIVDEPTAGLDPEERIRFRNLLERLGRDRTVLLSTHIVEDIAQTCRNVAVLSKGKIIFNGMVADLAQQAQGAVWLITCTPNETIPDDLQVVGITHNNTGTDYRVLGKPKEALRDKALPVIPSLEDGYIWLMQQQSSTSA